MILTRALPQFLGGASPLFPFSRRGFGLLPFSFFPLLLPLPLFFEGELSRRLFFFLHSPLMFFQFEYGQPLQSRESVIEGRVIAD